MKTTFTGTPFFIAWMDRKISFGPCTGFGKYFRW